MSHDLDDLTLAMFRSAGQMLRCGVAVRVPSLPRSRRLRLALEREAGRDPRVRLAYDAALAQAAKTAKPRQVKPRTLVRDSGVILQIR
jgi:hypothetical protein